MNIHKNHELKIRHPVPDIELTATKPEIEDPHSPE
jgi:hypothetical protein